MLRNSTLCMIATLAAGGLSACTDAPLPSPTVNAPSMAPPTAPGTLPDQRFSRPPPRDMDGSDGGPDALTDMASGDMAGSDMQPADMAGSDMGGPGPCQADPCVLAVDLTLCDPCPIARPTSWVAQTRCTVPFNQATPLFEYVPFDCTAACPQDSLQICNAPGGVPQCGVDGVCQVVSD